MRAFIGIDFNPKLKKQVLDIQNQLKRYAKKGRWTYIDNLHLTLKFLGEIDNQKLNLINNELNRIAKTQEAFKLNLSQLGAFNNHKLMNNISKIPIIQEYNKVMWLGFSGQVDKLRVLQQNIQNLLQSIGVEKEKRQYTPHLTIAQDVLLEIGLDIIEKDIDLKQMKDILVDRIYIFKSEQIGRSRVYTKVFEYIFHINNLSHSI